MCLSIYRQKKDDRITNVNPNYIDLKPAIFCLQRIVDLAMQQETRYNMLLFTQNSRINLVFMIENFFCIEKTLVKFDRNVAANVGFVPFMLQSENECILADKVSRLLFQSESQLQCFVERRLV